MSHAVEVDPYRKNFERLNSQQMKMYSLINPGKERGVKIDEATL